MSECSCSEKRKALGGCSKCSPGFWEDYGDPLDEDVDVVDEDWLSGVSCNPDAPEECESCQ